MKLKLNIATSIAAAACILSSSTASAALLFNFHDFNGTVSQVFASQGDFTGQLTSGTATLDTGGDNTTEFINDGTIRLAFTTATFTLTNTSVNTYVFTNLLVDAAVINPSPNAHLITSNFLPSFTPTTTFASGINSSAYQTFSFGTGGVTFNPGQSFVLTFKSDSARIDNIIFEGLMLQPLLDSELSAVPEPGSILSVGALLGSGMLMRSRRRSARA